MILIAGAGFVGVRIASRLHQSGHLATALTLNQSTSNSLSLQHPWPTTACDITNPNALDKLAKKFQQQGTPIHSIIHCASSNRGGPDAYRHIYLNGTKKLLQLQPKHFIFVSSTSVYSQNQGQRITEISETNPSRETSKILLETESLTLSAGHTVARLAGIYGPSRSFVLKRFLEGSARIEVKDHHSPNGRWLNQIHREDAASALIHLLDKPGIWNVTDSQPLTQRECFEYLSRRFHSPLPETAPPDLNRKRGWSHKIISSEKLQNSGWTPTYPSYIDALSKDPDLIPSITGS